MVGRGKVMNVGRGYVMNVVGSGRLYGWVGKSGGWVGQMGGCPVCSSGETRLGVKLCRLGR